MRKTYIIGIITTVIIIILVTMGIVIYNKNNSEKEKYEENEIVEQRNGVEENITKSNIELVTTSGNEEKTSPNCLFIFKTYYKKCEHITVEKVDIEDIMVNKTREDIEKIYNKWNVVTFRNDEILFYKEEDGICNEHYVLKEEGGYIAIYTLDENNNEKLKEVTGILTQYLPEDDTIRLKEGIRVDGKEKLNQTIEDYE